MSASRWSGGSMARAARSSSNSTRPGCSGCDFRLSAYLPSPSSTSRRRLRYSERNRLRRIVKSQADIFVPGSNELILAIARSKVSCTRSSARSTLPHSDIANARRLGTTPSIASRSDGARVIGAILCPSGWSKSLQQQLETFRHLLLPDFVEAILEALAEHGQDSAVETSTRLCLGGIVRHRR